MMQAKAKQAALEDCIAKCRRRSWTCEAAPVGRPRGVQGGKS